MDTMQVFLQSLQMMGKGMAGIFLVTGVMVLAMLLLRKLGEECA